MVFTLSSGDPVPAVSTAQMREVDRSMPEDFGIDLARMMENAGRNLADLGQALVTPRTAIVLAGPGGNGGGGLAAARHLHNRGVTVSVMLAGGPLAFGGRPPGSRGLVGAAAAPAGLVPPGHYLGARGVGGCGVDSMGEGWSVRRGRQARGRVEQGLDAG